MFDNINRIIKTLFNNNRNDNKKEPRIQIKNNKSNNTNKTNNNDMLNIVIPGHYCSNETLNSKVKEIIRIVGPDKNRQGYWFTQDGKSLNESIILDGYTLLSTNSHEKGKSFKGQKKKGKDIMKDFKPVDVNNNNDEYDDYYEEPEPKKSSPYDRKIPDNLNPDKQIINKQPEPKKHNPLIETKKLIEKASIDSLNNNYNKKYGTKPYKPVTLEIPIKIEIPYELNKLTQICELFDIEAKTVAQIILENIRLPEEIIYNYIIDKLESSNILNQSEPVSPKVVIENKPLIVENKNKETINNGISEIDDYISNMFK